MSITVRQWKPEQESWLVQVFIFRRVAVVQTVLQFAFSAPVSSLSIPAAWRRNSDSGSETLAIPRNINSAFGLANFRVESSFKIMTFVKLIYISWWEKFRNEWAEWNGARARSFVSNQLAINLMQYIRILVRIDAVGHFPSNHESLEYVYNCLQPANWHLLWSLSGTKFTLNCVFLLSRESFIIASTPVDEIHKLKQSSWLSRALKCFVCSSLCSSTFRTHWRSMDCRGIRLHHHIVDGR